MDHVDARHAVPASIRSRRLEVTQCKHEEHLVHCIFENAKSMP